MADWKRLTKALVLADGVIGEKDAEIIRREFLADGVINKSEAEFLIDLRSSAPKAVQKFHEFVFDVIQKALLADGAITPRRRLVGEVFARRWEGGRPRKGFPEAVEIGRTIELAEFDALVRKYAP